MATFEILAASSGSSSVVGYPEGTKMYVALLNQTGTNDPVATVLVNTFGGTVVWTYNTNGDYNAALAGVFTENKTWLLISAVMTDPSNTYTGFVFNRVDSSNINLRTYFGTDKTDNQLSNVAIQILVFPS